MYGMLSVKIRIIFFMAFSTFLQHQSLFSRLLGLHYGVLLCQHCNHSHMRTICTKDCHLTSIQQANVIHIILHLLHHPAKQFIKFRSLFVWAFTFSRL